MTDPRFVNSQRKTHVVKSPCLGRLASKATAAIGVPTNYCGKVTQRHYSLFTSDNAASHSLTRNLAYSVAKEITWFEVR